jgi:adenosylhomocysteine nucleosidase
MANPSWSGHLTPRFAVGSNGPNFEPYQEVSELVFGDPCLLFALRWESRGFLREFHPQQRFHGAPCWARFCGPAWLSVLVLHTGIGPARTETALDWLLGQPVLEGVPYRPKLVVSAGFSGALQERFQVGDIILGSEVRDVNGQCWPATWPAVLPPGEWRPPLHRGRLLSVAALITSPEEKQASGREHQAIAVDMETAVIARMCRQADIPFGCVRVILDDLQTPLSPRLVSLLSGRRVSPWRAMAALFARPSLAAEYARLARRAQFAAEHLGKALGELLTLTLPWGAEL